MQYRFHAEEWQALSRADRVLRCRLMAHEANELTRTAERDETKRVYFDLARQWERLAREIDAEAALTH